MKSPRATATRRSVLENQSQIRELPEARDTVTNVQIPEAGFDHVIEVNVHGGCSLLFIEIFRELLDIYRVPRSVATNRLFVRALPETTCNLATAVEQFPPDFDFRDFDRRLLSFVKPLFDVGAVEPRLFRETTLDELLLKLQELTRREALEPVTVKQFLFASH